MCHINKENILKVNKHMPSTGQVWSCWLLWGIASMCGLCYNGFFFRLLRSCDFLRSWSPHDAVSRYMLVKECDWNENKEKDMYMGIQMRKMKGEKVNLSGVETRKSGSLKFRLIQQSETWTTNPKNSWPHLLLCFNLKMHILCGVQSLICV